MTTCRLNFDLKSRLYTIGKRISGYDCHHHIAYAGMLNIEAVDAAHRKAPGGF